MKIKSILLVSSSALFGSMVSHGAILFTETFDNASGFTTSEPFFSDEAVSTGFDFFGISDGAGGGDFGTSDPAQTNVKPYTGFTGNFLTGMDLNGEGASLPIIVTWSGIIISGETGLSFSGDFAEFFDGGNIDASDQLFVEAQIDGGGFLKILEFTPGSFGSTTFNGVFELGADTLGNAAQTFTAGIAGTGNLLDLRLTVDLNSGDEDFGADNFIVSSADAPSAIPEPSTVVLGALGLLAVLRRRR